MITRLPEMFSMPFNVHVYEKKIALLEVISKRVVFLIHIFTYM